MTELASVQSVAAALAARGYIADEGLCTAVYLSVALRRPLLLEGEAGVGKTELAKVLADITAGELIRLQCYEGIDVSQAVYDWDYSRQLLHLRAAGLAGDIITALTGKPFYITSSRYRSMVTDYITPMDKTYALLGKPKISLEQGVKETISWLRTQPEYAPTP